ncbi:LPS-assembly protein LptD [Roseisalinus antarcticus]|uniref:LPS-assembly protein LptD n=1 Tax=Roseisalinus antarcticus TaxID=254357 RepID=A0A1Y5RI76_9RHOB|nr:LPS assembly protein LptD [Roseisalinus antarcticus]SLN18185.1 LPS-assembly protein LptD precursor [Roseisalinus antarcticus]
MRWLLVLLMLLPAAARAQGAATLVADRVQVTQARQLVAEGNVEVFYDGTRLSAARVTYDEATDQLAIVGPILIETPEGDILTADRASLDPQLENGLLRGARLVLQRQLQLAANRIDRVEGRYTQLYRTAATSCRVCGDRPPLWEIRAERVIHDEVAQQLYFDNAVLRVGGVPVAWVPRMRLPDPSVSRAAGLMVPEIRQTDRLGTGIRLPYFLPLGPSRDLRLTPYLSPETRTLELIYRQAWMRGDLRIAGAFTDDTLRPNGTRSYVFADVAVALAGNWRVDGQLRSASDRAYLIDYDYSDVDRLDSFLRLSRVREDDRLSFGVTVVESLREGDVNAELPTILPRLSYERVLRPAGLPGALTFTAGADAALRRSNADVVGRDTLRVGGGVDWTAGGVLAGGLLAEVSAGVTVNGYAIENDSAFPAHVLRSRSYGRAELRWPFSRRGTTGIVQVIEPIVSLSWSEVTGDAVPNEDSQVVELDEVNLLGLTRFPGDDARETGFRGALALNYAILAPGGREANLTFGRLFRETPDARLASGTGLDGTHSDWLLTAGIDLPSGFSFDARGLFDESLDFSRAEARLAWRNRRTDLAATYVELARAPDEGRPDAAAEWTLDAAYRITDIWSVSGEARYDLLSNAPLRAGLGVEYSNECVTVGLSASRRFTSSTTLEPETNYGLSIALNGFSAGRSAAPVRRTCRN